MKQILASALLILTAITSAVSAAAGLQNEIPAPEKYPTSGVYFCERHGGALVIDIVNMKLWMLDTKADLEGIPSQLSDLKEFRCAHTYKFKIDLLGMNGKLRGCGGGGISMHMTDDAQTESVDFDCQFQPAQPEPAK